MKVTAGKMHQRLASAIACGLLLTVGFAASAGPASAAELKRHYNSTNFGPRICGSGSYQGVSSSACITVGGQFVIADYAKDDGHNQYIHRVGAQFISASKVKNPWIDFDYYSTDGRHLSHWQGATQADSREYIRRIYPPSPYYYYNFDQAGQVCATLYSNPGQFPIRVAKTCVSVGPQSS